jgi:katanin p60 ATPase-containing subunit A1
VFLLAASNLPWDLDGAMLRRLEKRILVPLPEEKARENMLLKFIPPDKADNLDYSGFAKKLENYSGSDIRLVCKESAMKPLRRLLK